MFLLAHYFTSIVEDFINKANEDQNRSVHSLVTNQMEDLLFHIFFGCGAPIAFQLWNSLDENEFFSDTGKIHHMLRSLVMKQYPTEGVSCEVIGK